MAEEETEVVGDAVALVERALAKDGTTLIKLIQPGWGSSGYYSEELLRRDIAKAFPKGTHMYMDHPTVSQEKDRPERSIRDLAAVLTEDPHYDPKGKAGPGAYAKAQVVSTYKQAIEDLAPHIGTSIRALGRSEKGEAEGRQGPLITELTKGRSVDFVTQAGAGGQIVSLFESLRDQARADTIRTESDREGQKVPAELEEVTRARDTAQRELTEARAALVTARGENAELRTGRARLQEQIAIHEARDLIIEALAKSDLPAFTHKRIADALVKDLPFVEQNQAECIAAKKAAGATQAEADAACANVAASDRRLDREKFGKVVEAAVTSEREYIAKVKGSGQIKGMGSSNGDGGGDADTKISESLADSLSVFGLKPETAKRVAGGK